MNATLNREDHRSCSLCLFIPYISSLMYLLQQLSPCAFTTDPALSQPTLQTLDQPCQDKFISCHLHACLELLSHVLRIPALSNVLAADSHQLSALLQALLSTVLAVIGCRNSLIKSDLISKLNSESCAHASLSIVFLPKI